MSLAILEEALPPSLTWRQKLDAAAKAGFDALELFISDDDSRAARLEMPYGMRRAVRDFQNDSGVRIGSISLSIPCSLLLASPNPAARKRAIDILRGTVRFAENMGINLIQLADCDMDTLDMTADGAKYFEESLRSAALYAAASGVTVALGTGKSPFMNTVSKAAEFVRRIGMPNFGLYPDIGNLYCGVEPPEGADAPGELARLVTAELDSGRGHIFAAQLKDTRRDAHDGLFPGEGRVDFELIMAKLYELGVRRFAAVQRYTSDRADCWEEDLKRTASLMRGAWSKRKAGASHRANGD